MYKLLASFAQRPALFSRYTAKELWTRPHLSRQMLNYHLAGDNPIASRPFDSIDRLTAWLNDSLAFEGKRVCDLGCGPGLYASRFATYGADVTGVDFSMNSLEYARASATRAKQSITYLNADYLEDPLPFNFDVVTLIYLDYCALSPVQRHALLRRMHDMLVPGGRIYLDVVSKSALIERTEQSHIEPRLMNGFWAEGDYIGIQMTSIYPEAAVLLDRYLIVEPDESWQVFNWMQHFTKESLEAELSAAGFQIESWIDPTTVGLPTPDSPQLGVIACK